MPNFLNVTAVWTKGETLLMKGFERGEVTFLCSHLFAVKENKYLCRDPCEHTDVLVTVKSGRTAASDRISLKDLGNGSFSVTFSQLQLSDSGRYWCGVDRPGFDTYTEIQLTVMKGAYAPKHIALVSMSCCQAPLTQLHLTI